MKIIAHRFQTLQFIFSLVLTLFIGTAYGQPGIRHNSESAFKAYTLATAENQGITYLLDNCGKIVNQWAGTSPRHHCKLTEEGHIIYIQSNTIYEQDWNGNIVRAISPNTTDMYLDYEVIKLENGNYLAVSRRIIDDSEFEAIGWDPDLPVPGHTDGVVELDVDGNIVWEWNIKDHTIQDQISSAPNFGNVKDHPESKQ